MKRREFIAGISAAAWPLAARAQQRERVRRLGILWPAGVNDSVSNIWYDAFIQGLSELGWIEGRNLHIDVRRHPRDAGEARAFARELIDLHPDVLVTATPLLVRVLQQETHIIPIVMNGAGDPVVSGLVKSLSRPEGNTTGVTDIWISLSGRWLQLLREAIWVIWIIGGGAASGALLWIIAGWLQQRFENLSRFQAQLTTDRHPVSA